MADHPHKTSHNKVKAGSRASKAGGRKIKAGSHATAPRITTGAGPRRDAKLLSAEKRALGVK